MGANAAEGDAASSRRDFVSKFRIALKEGKETLFRLRLCRRRRFLEERHDAVIGECTELILILGRIVQKASRGGNNDK
jgi:four helix bundle protein